MNEHDVLAERFEVHRPRLRALAYQTLGSTTEAEDAVQETWLRLSRSDSGAIENLGGWLTTVVARVCLNMLAGRRDEPVGMVLPEPVASDGDGSGPEHEVLLADSIGPALLVICTRWRPPNGSHSSCTTSSLSRRHHHGRGQQAGHARGVHGHGSENHCDRPYRQSAPHRRSRPRHPRLTGHHPARVGSGAVSFVVRAERASPRRPSATTEGARDVTSNRAR